MMKVEAIIRFKYSSGVMKVEAIHALNIAKV